MSAAPSPTILELAPGPHPQPVLFGISGIIDALEQSIVGAPHGGGEEDDSERKLVLTRAADLITAAKIMIDGLTARF